MRKQYFFQPSSRGILAWDVDRLVRLSRHLPRKRVPLRDVQELGEPVDQDGKALTWRGLAEHVRLINEADLSFPIILSAAGRVMDGRHRVARAVLEGRETIEAVQFETDPEPDYVGVEPDELPYGEFD